MIITGMLLLTAWNLAAQQSAVFGSSGIAIKGYDAVAYFKALKPEKGSKQFSFTWNNADWLFSSQQNLDSFKLDPVKFAPQYGGYCAYGVSEDHKSPTDPEAWTISDGKLYLNYSLRIKELWRKEQAKRIADADVKWPLLMSKE